MYQHIIIIALIACSTGCAALHRTQLGDIEPASGSKHISVKVSQDTLDLREIAALAKIGGDVFKSKGASAAGKGLETYTMLFQFGPRIEESSPMILFIPFGSGFVDDARHRLVSKCEGGSIEGMLTKFERHDYFLGLIQTQNVIMQGYCNKSNNPHSKKS